MRIIFGFKIGVMIGVKVCIGFAALLVIHGKAVLYLSDNSP